MIQALGHRLLDIPRMLEPNIRLYEVCCPCEEGLERLTSALAYLEEGMSTFDLLLQRRGVQLKGFQTHEL